MKISETTGQEHSSKSRNYTSKKSCDL